MFICGFDYLPEAICLLISKPINSLKNLAEFVNVVIRRHLVGSRVD